MEKTPASAKAGYHHGNLKAALIEAADAILRDSGIEGFSLREAARRAGVSIGAPAHHFGSAMGLLTEVALLGYESLGAALASVPPGAAPGDDLGTLTLAYVGFALDHPGRFRLMFRPDLVNREDPRYQSVSTAALSPLARSIAARRGGMEMGDLFLAWAQVHGLANLVLDGKARYLFDDAAPDVFVRDILPGILDRSWTPGTGA